MCCAGVDHTYGESLSLVWNKWGRTQQRLDVHVCSTNTRRSCWETLRCLMRSWHTIIRSHSLKIALMVQTYFKKNILGKEMEEWPRLGLDTQERLPILMHSYWHYWFLIWQGSSVLCGLFGHYRKKQWRIKTGAQIHSEDWRRLCLHAFCFLLLI